MSLTGLVMRFFLVTLISLSVWAILLLGYGGRTGITKLRELLALALIVCWYKLLLYLSPFCDHTTMGTQTHNCSGSIEDPERKGHLRCQTSPCYDLDRAVPGRNTDLHPPVHRGCKYFGRY